MQIVSKEAHCWSCEAYIDILRNHSLLYHSFTFLSLSPQNPREALCVGCCSAMLYDLAALHLLSHCRHKRWRKRSLKGQVGAAESANSTEAAEEDDLAVKRIEVYRC